MPSFTAIDFETANASRGSPCQVGVVKVRGGTIVDEVTRLIRPPARTGHFERRNVQIHGITAEMVANQPGWSQALPRLLNFVGSDVLVAHNASFEASVFQQACEADELPPPSLDFLCTMQLSRRALSLPSYRLPDVTEELGIQFSGHHDAGADARGAAEIAIRLARARQISSVRALADVYGLRLGHVDAAGASSHTRRSRQRPAPINTNTDADPTGHFYGRVVVFTGRLDALTRQAAKDSVASRGGTTESQVTTRTDIVVTGNPSSRSRGKPSIKAQRAADLQLQGYRIQIITETEFLNRLDAQG